MNINSISLQVERGESKKRNYGMEESCLMTIEFGIREVSSLDGKGKREPRMMRRQLVS